MQFSVGIPLSRLHAGLHVASLVGVLFRHSHTCILFKHLAEIPSLRSILLPQSLSDVQSFVQAGTKPIDEVGSAAIV